MTAWTNAELGRIGTAHDKELNERIDAAYRSTKMGGAGAPDDRRLGHLTQEWLATSDDPEARTSGGYWHHLRRAEPGPSVHDQRLQDQLLEELARFTATPLVRSGWADARAIA